MAAAPLRTAGAAFEALCARIMATVGVDAGGRGIAHITPLHAQLPRAALHFVLSPSVVVLTGERWLDSSGSLSPLPNLTPSPYRLSVSCSGLATNGD